VCQPIGGVIDVVLDARLSPDDPGRGVSRTIACEAHSELRRIEQQIRWAGAKTDALALARSRAGQSTEITRLLLLRSTRATRAVAATYADLLAAAYPARSAEAFDALTASAAWPGSAMIWCVVTRPTAELLREPPPGIRVGR
jgi:hypothetical protein